MRPGFVSALVLASQLGSTALAQQAVSAQPQTFVTWNNQISAYQAGPATAYSG